jgi:protocatechuate 3,4-dioxygenase beta subunit
VSDLHDLGLSHDLPVLLKRRSALALLGGVGLSAVLTACGGSGSAPTGSSGHTGASAAIPEETAGPFPGDGTNGVNALTTSGIVRSDITHSVGGASGVAEGVPLDINLRVLDLSDGSAPLAGAAVYVWHCDGQGRYSLYDAAIANENYMRGVQAADTDGWVRFKSIYPGAYSGRWPHVHFEVYPSLDAATSAGTKLRTSQMALPEAASRKVYATSWYGGSLANLGQTSLSSDMVFSDGYSLQMADVTGSAGSGLAATLNVPV